MRSSWAAMGRRRYGTFLLACIPGMMIVSMLGSTARVEAAVAPPCPGGVEANINRKLAPCRRFLSGSESRPPAQCCTGVKSLNAGYKTAADRQRACSCLKVSFAKHQPAFKLPSAQSLPRLCNINIGYSITPNFDCSRVK